MNYTIDMNAAEPAYIQLYKCMVRDITAGIYAFGEKLPSKRGIALETGLSVITVEHALALLSEEGYIETRLRSGCFVLYRSADFHSRPERAAAPQERRAREARGVDYFPFSVISKTVRRVLLEWGEQLFERSPNFGMPELKYEICRYLSRSRGISVAPDEVIIGSGAEYLYGLVAQYLGAGRVFALEDPSYDKIRRVYEAHGIVCELLPMARDGIASGALAASRAGVLHLTPFNSYPSGITADISKKHEYLRWARERGGVIIEDNFDSELTVSHKAEEPLFSMAGGADVIYINTFSRTIAPSLRVGYMLLPRSMAEDFRAKLGFYSCTVPVLDQIVIAELLKNGDFERHVNRVRRKRRSEMKGE